MKKNGSTTDEKRKALPDKGMVFGCDVGKDSLYLRGYRTEDKSEITSKAHSFTNDEDGHEKMLEWMKDTAARAGAEPTEIVVGMEPTGIYGHRVWAFLVSRGVLVVHVNPASVKRAKELADNSPRKSDMKDPKTIAWLVLEGMYQRPYMPTGTYLELRRHADWAEDATNDRTVTKNRLQQKLTEGFPELLKAVSDPFAKSVLTVLKKAPSAEAIAEMTVEKIQEIWHEEKIRGAGASKRRAEDILEAAKKHVVRNEDTNLGPRILELIEDYERYDARKREHEEKMAELVMSIPNGAAIAAINGIGAATAARIVAEIGDISRFSSPKQLVKLAGLEVVSCSSGKKTGKSHISHRGRKKLRRILWQVAMTLVRHNEAFREIHTYFTTRQNKPLSKNESLIAVACKACRVIGRLLMSGGEFDGGKMLRDIHRSDAA